MALAFEVTAVPAELATFYKASGDKFVLDVEGAVPASQLATAAAKVTELEGKVGEFRTNNIALKQQLEAAGKQTVDVEALLEPRVNEMKTNYTTQIKTLTESNAALGLHLERVLLSDSVKDAAIKYGVLETALPDVLNRAREQFAVKDGVAVSKDKAMDKEGKPLTVNAWLTNLTETATHLFAQSRGAGGQRPVSQHNQTPVLTSTQKIAAGLSAAKK